MSRKWRGTALFAVIMAGVSVTVAGRLATGGGASGSPVLTPQAGATDAAQPSPTASGTPSTGSGSAPGTGAAPSAGTSGSGASGGATTVTGDVEQTQFGPVQVSLTYSGSKITSVQTLQAPTGTGRDEMLTNYAVPQLEHEVISSQSARVDTISGATYTSGGYLASVQSAIDKHQ
ncbi:FMN-binding protein [Gryllotalpicola reticulitermitis]|uniref:FMN-binding protein n=1 Tax=Gryllotalpicola reticulitermitis TaxID=1184153 RepID=A0ABV8Q3B4_9MICO